MLIMTFQVTMQSDFKFVPSDSVKQKVRACESWAHVSNVEMTVPVYWLLGLNCPRVTTLGNQYLLTVWMLLYVDIACDTL
jgi:hypothetical protein